MPVPLPAGKTTLNIRSCLCSLLLFNIVTGQTQTFLLSGEVVRTYREREIGSSHLGHKQLQSLEDRRETGWDCGAIF